MRADGCNSPDGLALIPWQAGRSVAWDVSVLTHSLRLTAANLIAAGAAAAAASVRKSVKYASFASITYIFIPSAWETLDTTKIEALEFFVELGRRIAVNSNDNRHLLFFSVFPWSRNVSKQSSFRVLLHGHINRLHVATDRMSQVCILIM
jgi:hypothetical protein